MPLSAPAPRRHYHTRQVACRGYFREDGLWDIEGHMTDVKTYAFENSDRGTVAPGEPVHEMSIRLTIDDSMVIRDIEAVTEHGPFTLCGDIAPAYRKLIGIRIGAGFRQQVRERMGGAAGCTHLTELLFPMATTAFQTAYASRQQARRDAGLPEETNPWERKGRKPPQIDSCHALASDGRVVRENWPQHYTGPDVPAESET